MLFVDIVVIWIQFGCKFRQKNTNGQTFETKSDAAEQK